MLIVFSVNRFPRNEEWIHVQVEASGDEWWWVQEPPKRWYATHIKNGQFAYNTFGKRVAKIQSIERFDMGDQKQRIIAHIEVLAIFNPKTESYYYNYQPLQTGKPLEFTFGTDNLRGLVTHVGASSPTSSTKTVEVKILAAHDWESSALETGMITLGNYAKILQLEQQDATIVESVGSTNDRFFVPATGTQRKDITMKLEIKIFNTDGADFTADGTPLKIGNSIHLEFPTISIKKALISRIF